MKHDVKEKVGFGGLTGLIIGGTIGSGIFALPATLTAGANPEGILIGWTIVAVGMFSLAGVYRNLTLQQPEIDDGIYGWSKHLFGDLCGFIANYGHGIGDAVGNASYLTVIFSAFGGFGLFAFFGNGTTWPAVVAASILLWIVTGFVLRGVHTSTVMNNITTIAKVIPISLFIILAILNFSPHTFMAHFNSTQVFNITNQMWEHVSILDQSKSVLLSAMWTLIGIESGTIFATRARKLSDVARATNIGAIFVIILLVGTSVLSLGLMAPSKISALHDPSLAGLMAKMVGNWGGWLINACLIISVIGALIAWVSLCSEEIRVASRGGSATKWLNELNQNEAPKNALLITSSLTQFLLILAGLYSAGYVVLLKFSTSLAVVPYFFTSLYALKSVIKGTGFKGRSSHERLSSAIVALLSTAFTLFMIFGAGLRYLLLGAIIWMTGFWFYYKGKQEKNEKMSRSEWFWWGIIALMAISGIIGLLTGTLNIK